MIKSFVKVLNRSTLKNPNGFRTIFLKQSFSSSKNYQSLKSSNFAKQLGLQQQFRQVIKLQKKNESNKFQMSAIIFLLIFMGCGTLLIVSMIDSNEWKLFKYRVGKWFGKEDKGQKVEGESQKQSYEKNLRQIFNKKFRDRSVVDARFLRYIEEYVEESIKKVNKLKNNSDAKELQLNGDMVYIIQKLADKFIQSSQQKLVKNKQQVLSLFEKIVYHEFTNLNVSKKHETISKSLLKGPELKLCQKLSKFLLIKGGLNHQLLGLKYLQSCSDSDMKSFFLNELSKEQIEEVNKRIRTNNQIYEKSLRLSSSNVENQQSSDLEVRIVKVKEQILYSIQELKRVNEIQKAKLNYMQETFNQLAQNYSKSNKESKKK